MSRAEKYLPFVLAALAPALSIIINSMDFSEYDLIMLATKYIQASAFILLIWYLNRWLLNADYKLEKMVGRNTIIFIVNVSIVVTIFSMDYWLNINLIENTPQWLLALRFTFAILIFNVILRTFKAQKESASLKVQNLSLQAENLKFQIETLKQQVNPHFLFNSLNTLLDLIEDDQEAAAKYVRNFSKLYRVVLQSAKHDFIPLVDELKFLEDYWSLLKVRFHEAIELNITINDDKMSHLIPPLSLQFLIENAVKHNEASKRNPLLIEIEEIDQSLIVKNRINAKSYPVEGEKVGMKNLQQRFTMLHKPIKYGRENDHFVVSVPLKTI